MFTSQSAASSMPLSTSSGAPELAVPGKTSEFIGRLEELKHKKFKLVGIKLDADPVGNWDVNRSHMFVVMLFENKEKDQKYLRADWHKSGFTTQVADRPSDLRQYMGQLDYDADLADATNTIMFNSNIINAISSAAAKAAGGTIPFSVPVATAVGAFAIVGGVVVGGLYFRAERYHADAKFVTPKTIKKIEVLKGWLMDFHTPDMRYNLYDNNCQHVAKAIFHVVTELDDDSDSDL